MFSDRGVALARCEIYDNRVAERKEGLLLPASSSIDFSAGETARSPFAGISPFSPSRGSTLLIRVDAHAPRTPRALKICVHAPRRGVEARRRRVIYVAGITKNSIRSIHRRKGRPSFFCVPSTRASVCRGVCAGDFGRAGSRSCGILIGDRRSIREDDRVECSAE